MNIKMDVSLNYRLSYLNFGTFDHYDVIVNDHLAIFCPVFHGSLHLIIWCSVPFYSQKSPAIWPYLLTFAILSYSKYVN